MVLCVQLCLDLRLSKSLKGPAVFQGLFGGSGSKSGIAVVLKIVGLSSGGQNSVVQPQMLSQDDPK